MSAALGACVRPVAVVVAPGSGRVSGIEAGSPGVWGAYRATGVGSVVARAGVGRVSGAEAGSPGVWGAYRATGVPEPRFGARIGRTAAVPAAVPRTAAGVAR